MTLEKLGCSFGALFCLITTTTFAQSPGSSSFEELRARFVAAHIAGDATKIASLYSADATIAGADRRPVVTGSEEIETYYR